MSCTKFFVFLFPAEWDTQSSDFPLWTPLRDDFSKDAELSSLVSIKPDRNCSQWLSSVSDMKECAPSVDLRAPAIPEQRGGGSKKMHRVEIQGHLHCKTNRNVVKNLCMFRHTAFGVFWFMEGIMKKGKNGQWWMTEDLVSVIYEALIFL